VRKLLIIGILVGTLMMLTVSTALAAQGQITEVNPSGIGVAKHASANRVFGALIRAGVVLEELDRVEGLSD